MKTKKLTKQQEESILLKEAIKLHKMGIYNLDLEQVIIRSCTQLNTFLAPWSVTEGKPMNEPLGGSYDYRVGDYYVIQENTLLPDKKKLYHYKMPHNVPEYSVNDNEYEVVESKTRFNYIVWDGKEFVYLTFDDMINHGADKRIYGEEKK